MTALDAAPGDPAPGGRPGEETGPAAPAAGCGGGGR